MSPSDIARDIVSKLGAGFWPPATEVLSKQYGYTEQEITAAFAYLSGVLAAVQGPVK